MSSLIWLLFLDKNTTLESFFTHINIPIDSEFLVVLRRDDHIVLKEVYRVSPAHPLQTYHFGNWTVDGGLIGPAVGLYNRRNNLQGLVLKTATVQVRKTVTSLWAS